jgi:hypothetical protein
VFCSEVNSTAALEAELSATAVGAIWVASTPRGLNLRSGIVLPPRNRKGGVGKPLPTGVCAPALPRRWADHESGEIADTASARGSRVKSVSTHVELHTNGTWCLGTGRSWSSA